MMRTASFCKENEIPDENGGCVCRNGRTCGHNQRNGVFSDFYIDVVVLNIVSVFIIIGLFYYSMLHLRAFVRVYKKAKKCESNNNCENTNTEREFLNNGKEGPNGDIVKYGNVIRRVPIKETDFV